MGRQRMMISKTQSIRLRNVTIASLALLVFYVFLLHPADQNLDSSRATKAKFNDFPGASYGSGSGSGRGSSAKQKPPSWQKLSPELLNDRFMNSQQCASTFPGLTKEVDDVVAKGSFTLTKTSELGPLIARIKDGKVGYQGFKNVLSEQKRPWLYILQAGRRNDFSDDMLQHRAASLHQIAAALLTAPHPSEIPDDTVFALNYRDEPTESTFSYSRPADPALHGKPGRSYFPIPHFSFWSWPLPFIGSFSRAAAAIQKLEEGADGKDTSTVTPLSWRDKDSRAVWRGTAHFNNVRAGRMRQELLRTAAGKPWSDIAALQWTTGATNASNALAIEDFCRYRYVVHTEGITYSGRFQFHQLCASVVLTPPLAWMQHLTHLVRPVFSYDLPSLAAADDGDDKSSSGNTKTATATIERKLRPPKEYGNGVHEKLSLAPYPAPWVQQAWPRSYTTYHNRHSTAKDADVADDEEGPNIVFVAPDWSDLESVVAWLEAHPRAAEGIARRQRALFHGRGYFSPAAEMCYWRAALRGWTRTVRYEDGLVAALGDGVPWEEFSLKEIHR
ncbi:hypothetical protein PG997_004848 [Apiospora hydei]|uniref:Glycosyl transferase CAP10 domain-containing protein n=1 Tax=Apiospora hydei TaxID=1337664 RepID=A0ABR1X3A4_9PEZI